MWVGCVMAVTRTRAGAWARLGTGSAWRGESGQAAVLLTLLLMSLLGIAGFVIDYGDWVVNRHQVQNAADAAALAGASAPLQTVQQPSPSCADGKAVGRPRRGANRNAVVR